MVNILLIIGALISSVGSLPYILAVMRGTARPQLVSWFVWTILAGIMTVSTFLEGQRASTMLSLEGFVACAIVVILGLRQGQYHLNKLDIVCLSGAIVGILSLIVLRDPFIALVVSIIVDIIAFIPTLIHGWNSPREESFACFMCAAVAAGISLMVALHVHSPFMGMLYPAYAVLFNGCMSGILLVGRLAERDDYQYEADEA